MKQLKELTSEELKELFKTNNYISSKAYELDYENKMTMQEEEGRLMGVEIFDYHDNYNSFYLTTPVIYGGKEPEAVAHKLSRDYMNEDNAKLYDKLNDLTDKWENMDTDKQDENAELYNEMTETCDKLAKGITEQLRAYEQVSEADAIETLLYEVECGYLGELETDGEKVYETLRNVYS